MGMKSEKRETRKEFAVVALVCLSTIAMKRTDAVQLIVFQFRFSYSLQREIRLSWDRVCVCVCVWISFRNGGFTLLQEIRFVRFLTHSLAHSLLLLPFRLCPSPSPLFFSISLSLSPHFFIFQTKSHSFLNG